jgi:5-carboxymethyl-2-hydroxymuconate isomerase
MPHLTLEYSDNLEFAVQPLLARLHAALAATGAVALKGLKSRAVRHTDYRMADGNPEYAFAHLSLLIRAGRPQETQQELARRALEVLEAEFGHRYETGYLSLSVDIKEMAEEIAITKHNIPAEGVGSRTGG